MTRKRDDQSQEYSPAVKECEAELRALWIASRAQGAKNLRNYRVIGQQFLAAKKIKGEEFDSWADTIFKPDGYDKSRREKVMKLVNGWSHIEPLLEDEKKWPYLDYTVENAVKIIKAAERKEAKRPRLRLIRTST